MKVCFLGIPIDLKKRLVAEEVVAFSATHTGLRTDVLVDQPIQFENVLLNTGGGYHEKHSLFIAPQGGIYLFSASVLSTNRGDVVHGAMLHNGNVLAKLYARGDGGGHDQGCVTILVSLTAGDEIWVSNIYSATGYWGDSYTTFSGYLLWPM